MKKFLFIALLVISGNLLAQSNTNIYLFDIVNDATGVRFENLKVVSNQNGYDNQPSFFDNSTLLFVSTRNGQTDIAKYDLTSDTFSWVTNTPQGSEYSPLTIPNSKDVSAIRLDSTGLQRLYRYNAETGQPTLLIDKLKVGYHVWDNEAQLVTSVLVKNGMNLMLNFLPEQKNNTIDQGVGRSLHKIPNSEAISFTRSIKGSGMISSYNPKNGKIKDLFHMPSKAQDIAWLNENAILIPEGNRILLATPGEEKSLKTLHQFEEKVIYNISRIAVSPDGKHLAVVSDENPEIIVNKQLKTFNSKDLDQFVTCFSDAVDVLNFPTNTLYSGRDQMRAIYDQHMSENLNTKIEVVQRMKIGNLLIDEEIVHEDEEVYHQVGIYEVINGQITRATFIHENDVSKEIGDIVARQHEAYNNRDIDGFTNVYADDVALADFPNTVTSNGKAELRNTYAGFFERAKDLQRTVEKRIVVGNKVIDEEIVAIGSAKFRTISIYEIENDRIKKVTVLR